MTPRSNYHSVLNHKTEGSTEFTVDPAFVTYGSDGDGALTCKTAAVMLLPRYIGQEYLSNIASFVDILSYSQQVKQELISIL